jgi:hypothetical protein
MQALYPSPHRQGRGDSMPPGPARKAADRTPGYDPRPRRAGSRPREMVPGTFFVASPAVALENSHGARARGGRVGRDAEPPARGD